MTVAPAAARAGGSIGAALGVSGAALAAGAIAGWVTTPDDASRSVGSRNGFRYKVEAESREAALDKIRSQRDSARLALGAGSVVTGASMFLNGAARAGVMAVGALFMGWGGASLLTLRDGEENVAHLPSEQDQPPRRQGPWQPTLPQLEGTYVRPTQGGIPTLAERLAADGAGS